MIVEEYSISVVTEECNISVIEGEEFNITTDIEMAQREKQDINLYQGDTRSYQFNFFTDAAQTVEWDISAATSVLLGVKKTLDSTAVLFDVEATDTENGNDWVNGVVVFEITYAESVLLTQNGKYDVQIELGGSLFTPVYGDVVVQKQVTPPPGP